MKIKIDQDKCIACGTCVAVCAELFAIGNTGKAILKDSISPDKNELDIEKSECAGEAVDMCPVGCIKLSP